MKIDSECNYLSLNNYNYLIVDNISTYKYEDFSFYSLTQKEKIENVEEFKYLIIDSPFSDAFSHWVYECAIYLELYLNLKILYPELKLISGNRKKFKSLFYKFFKIDENDVFLSIDQTKNNQCFLPKPISCLNHKKNCREYEDLVKNFIKYFECCHVQKSLDFLLLPRQIKENFAPNDRKYDVTEIQNLIENETIKNSKVLNTDEIECLENQIKIVNKSKNIIVTDGSPFLVNGMFSNNSNIILIGNHTQFQSSEYPKMKFLYQLIQNKNLSIRRILSDCISYTTLKNIINIST